MFRAFSVERVSEEPDELRLFCCTRGGALAQQQRRVEAWAERIWRGLAIIALTLLFLVTSSFAAWYPSR